MEVIKLKVMRKEIDFVKNRKKYFIISGALILIAVISTFLFGVLLDIQFKGGAIITYSYEGELDKDELGSLVEETIGMQVSVQQSTDISTGKDNVVVSVVDAKSLDAETQSALSTEIEQKFSDNNIELMQISNVDPTIGNEFLMKSIVAVGLAMLLMIIYIAFRFRKIGGWSAGVMSVIALLHDCIVVYAVFIIFRLPLDLNFIAVLLTILGYSINATIVVYDRIRENKRLHSRDWSFDMLVNKSINQSITRSVNTTIATLISMVVVCVVGLIFNLDSIFTFAFPLCIGLVCGCYSSLCIAVPLWTVWQDHKAGKTGYKKTKQKLRV